MESTPKWLEEDAQDEVTRDDQDVPEQTPLQEVAIDTGSAPPLPKS